MASRKSRGVPQKKSACESFVFIFMYNDRLLFASQKEEDFYNRVKGYINGDCINEGEVKDFLSKSSFYKYDLVRLQSYEIEVSDVTVTSFDVRFGTPVAI